MNNILQIVFVVVVSILIYIFYREDNRHYLRNLFYSHGHNKENYMNQRLQPIKQLTKVNSENLKTCVDKVRSKIAENVNRMGNTSNLHMFNLDEIKNIKDKKNLNRSQKIAALNCSYWDLDNDAINKLAVPQSGELFIA